MSHPWCCTPSGRIALSVPGWEGLPGESNKPTGISGGHTSGQQRLAATNFLSTTGV